MTMLSQWQPFRELTSVQERVNQLLNNMFSDTGITGSEQRNGSPVFAPLADVYEDKDKFIIALEIPGVNENDLNVTLEGNVLSIRGERQFSKENKARNFQRVERAYGTFARSFTLPGIVDPNSIAAHYEHGVLELQLTKRAEAKPKQIKIAVGQKQLTTGKAA
jgi:HSP20 family protein